MGPVALFFALAGAEPVSYDGHRLVRVHPEGDEHERALRGLHLDVWSHGRGVDGSVLVRVPPREWAALSATGIEIHLVDPDLGPAVAEERARLVGGGAQGGGFFDDFRDYAALDARLDELTALAPDLATVVDVGLSIEGRPIRGVKIGSSNAAEPPALLVTGTMHAREWISPMVTACLAERFVLEHETDPGIAELLGTIDVIAIPVLNPDGYVYSWDVERYWRKNRRDGIGVDLNRNFPLGWGGPGSSGDPSAEDYRGQAPLSEPEAAALAAFIDARPEIAAHVDFHSFGQLILHPWSYTEMLAPDHDALADLATAQASAMLDAGGADYTVLAGAQLYPAAGVVDDWVYDAHDIFGFATELPPGPEGPGDFVVSPQLIAPTCDDQWTAMLVLAAWVAELADDPGGTTGGGDTSGGDSSTGTGAADTGTASLGTSAPADDTSASPPATTDPIPAGTTEGDDGSTSGAGEADDAGGCGCRASGGAGGAWALACMAAIGGRRRRRPGAPEPARVRL